jgi:DNA polymerase IV
VNLPDMENPPAPPGVPIRRILLVDCDAFFVQVARLEDPDGVGQIPRLIVGGGGGRGVVTSASYEVRAQGVRSGMPVAEALRCCPDATVVPVPRQACVGRSREIRRTLETLAPVVEAASIDEFYLDLSGTERLPGFESLAVAAAHIQTRVLADTQVQVSIGGGTNRLVAKLAAGRAKPFGTHVISPGAEASFMATLSVRAIPGVGPALAEALEVRGIRSVPELLRVEEAWLARWVGEARAGWLRARAQGIDPTPVTPGDERKSISAERTFAEDVPPGGSGDAFLEGRLLELAMRVGETLRDQGLRARTVTVKLRDADFTTRTRARTIPGGATSDRTIWQVGSELLRELRQAARPTRLLGIGLSALEDAGRGGDAEPQLDLLPDTLPPPRIPQGESPRARTLSRVADEVRARFGQGALRPGRTLEND